MTAAVQYSGSYTRPAEPVTPKAVGSRWLFRSEHWSVNERSGQACTIVEANESGWPYVIAFADGKRCNAVDCELLEGESAVRVALSGERRTR